jgi:hypothetical protein
MNFEDAFTQLMCHKKIRRKKWEPLMHMKIDKFEIRTYKGESFGLHSGAEILLTKDWYVIGEEEPKYTFVEALPELKKKKMLTNESLDGGYIFIDNGHLAICKPVEYEFMPTFEDMTSLDWETMK